MKKYYLFEEKLYHEDYVLWLQMLRDGCIAVACEEALVSWRLIHNSRSYNKFKSAKNRWRIYREYLKLPFFKTVYCFFAYAVYGLKKYFLN